METVQPGLGDFAAKNGRFALFGGSFDPPHRGHLAIAGAAADAFGLRRVLFAPTARQPLKPGGAHASFADRLAMVALACRQDPRFVASPIDAPRPDHRPNYTVDTLTELGRQHPGVELYAIAGADSFLDLPRWHEASRLFALAEWIVVSRPGFDLGRLDDLGLTAGQRARVHVLPGVADPASATDLRERLAAGLDAADLLLPEVADYIREHQLYR